MRHTYKRIDAASIETGDTVLFEIKQHGIVRSTEGKVGSITRGKDGSFRFSTEAGHLIIQIREGQATCYLVRKGEQSSVELFDWPMVG